MTTNQQNEMFSTPRPQILTFFVAQKNQRGEFLLGPKTYKTRAEAQSYIHTVLGGHGTVVLAAGNVSLELVREAA
jgi:hypothetical protein